VIMVTESYLMVFETSFLFVLMSAVLYRGPSEWQARIGLNESDKANRELIQGDDGVTIDPA